MDIDGVNTVYGKTQLDPYGIKDIYASEKTVTYIQYHIQRLPKGAMILNELLTKRDAFKVQDAYDIQNTTRKQKLLYTCCW